MKNFQNLIIITALILFSNLSLFGQRGNMPPNTEPGKCYAKCLIPDQYEEIEETFFIYTGALDNTISLDSLYFSIDKNTSELIHQGHKKDMTYRQLDSIESFEKMVFLVSWEETEHYVEETISFKKLVKEGGLEWREVLCGDKVNSGTIVDVQKALAQKGYLKTGSNSGMLTKEVKAALTDFQKENNLPMGQLDVESLEALEVYNY